MEYLSFMGHNVMYNNCIAKSFNFDLLMKIKSYHDIVYSTKQKVIC